LRGLVGTISRECLDWLIPLNERYLRRILRERVTHDNRGRPHASLGPGGICRWLLNVARSHLYSLINEHDLGFRRAAPCRHLPTFVASEGQEKGNATIAVDGR
jgi:hypothetical protein